MLKEKWKIEFNGRNDNWGYYCEAFVAGQAARRDAEGHYWEGGASLVDVSFQDHNLDVKRGFIEQARTAAGKTTCLGFMGARLSEKRTLQAREGITAYAIVVPSRDGAIVNTYRDGSINIAVPEPESWYLVPSTAINSMFSRQLNVAGKATGLNLYCPIRIAEQWKQEIL